MTAEDLAAAAAVGERLTKEALAREAEKLDRATEALRRATEEGRIRAPQEEEKQELDPALALQLNIESEIRVDQRALALYAQDRARLESGNCLPSDEEQRITKAIEVARMWVAADPTGSMQAEGLAEALSNANQHEAALSEFSRAISLLETQLPLNRMLAKRAQTLANLGRLEEAFADLDRASLGDAYQRERLQGRAAVANGDYASAIPHLERTAELAPARPVEPIEAGPKLELAEAYWHAGRKADAFAKVEEAIAAATAVERGATAIMQRWHDAVERFCPGPKY